MRFCNDRVPITARLLNSYGPDFEPSELSRSFSHSLSLSPWEWRPREKWRRSAERLFTSCSCARFAMTSSLFKHACEPESKFGLCPANSQNDDHRSFVPSRYINTFKAVLIEFKHSRYSRSSWVYTFRYRADRFVGCGEFEDRLETVRPSINSKTQLQTP